MLPLLIRQTERVWINIWLGRVKGSWQFLSAQRDRLVERVALLGDTAEARLLRLEKL